jgi:putative addiction module component (TIGR02574 family)
MTKRTQKLLDEIFALPDEERIIILDSLMACEALRHAGSAEIADSWDSEVARRLEEIDSGKVKAVLWNEVRDMVAAAHHPENRVTGKVDSGMIPPKPPQDQSTQSLPTTHFDEEVA